MSHILFSCNKLQAEPKGVDFRTWNSVLQLVTMLGDRSAFCCIVFLLGLVAGVGVSTTAVEWRPTNILQHTVQVVELNILMSQCF